MRSLEPGNLEPGLPCAAPGLAGFDAAASGPIATGARPSAAPTAATSTAPSAAPSAAPSPVAVAGPSHCKLWPVPSS